MFSAEQRWPAATPVPRPCAFFFEPLFLRDQLLLHAALVLADTRGQLDRR